MENAADSLKIAFAVFIFVIAITITFSLISQAKETSDVVLYASDETNLYTHINSEGENKIYREVSISDIISTLYRYYKESIGVTINLDGTVRTFDLTQSYANVTAIESELKDFINNTLLNYSDRTFIEEFVEVPISGIYMTADDDTQITLSSGGKKVYVTYTLKLSN